MKRLWVLIFLVLAGCKEVKIENGRIPAEYLTLAAQFMGSYTGKFNGKESTLTLRLEGDIVKVAYHDENGSDILGARCASSFGLLETIYVGGGQSNPKLDQANFVFNPNQCAAQILGRQLHLDFTKRNSGITVMAGILERRDWETNCGGGGSPYPSGCTTRQVNVYLLGNFKKLN